MSILSFSQANYPKKIKLEGDTCVLITVPQLKIINQRLLQRRFLLAENDSVRNFNKEMIEFVKLKNIQIDSLLKLNVNYSLRLKNELDLNLQYSKDKQSLEDKLRRKKRYFWIGLGVSFLTGFLLAK